MPPLESDEEEQKKTRKRIKNLKSKQINYYYIFCMSTIKLLKNTI